MTKELRALVVTAALLGSLAGSSAFAAPLQKNQEPRTEQQITKEVRHQLLLLPYYTVFDNLAYRVEGDTVVLEGQVVRPTLKSDAEAAVKSVTGVEKVVNNIEVLPPSPMDDQIRRAEYRAIYSEPSLSKYGWSALPTIHIIVKGGHVTLVGVVDNEGDKNLAGLRANQVPNVFSVTNDLRVGNNGTPK
jgi:hyperosmotically inducible protein